MGVIDLLVANARIVDGSGAPAFPGSVAVQGDRIVRILAPDEPEMPAARRVDAGGRTLVPGFVDAHSHSDVTPFVEPGMDSMLRQGVTTLVVGNCGGSAFPAQGAAEMAALAGVDVDVLGATWVTFGEYLERIDASSPALNVAALVGHGTLREAVLRDDQRRAPTAVEMIEMQRLLASALDEGAVGLSTGLIYAPGLHATTDEIVELATAVERHGGLYASHVRGEGTQVFDAVAECIEIGRRAGIPSHVSHLKVEGSAMWGTAERLLALVDAERAGRRRRLGRPVPLHGLGNRARLGTPSVGNTHRARRCPRRSGPARAPPHVDRARRARVGERRPGCRVGSRDARLVRTRA